MNKLMALKPENYNRFLALLIQLAQLVIKVYGKFIDDAGFARAGSLAYSTLMASVPFAALIISLMSAFGALDTVQNEIMDFIVQLLIPTRQAEIKGLLDQFLANSNTLGVLGLVFFTITSVMLLDTVNTNLNAIWGSKVKTNFLNKFTTYASVIIFGTLLLAASTTLSSRFSFVPIENIAVLNRILLMIAPYIFDFLVIMLLIGITPSGRVQIRYLLIVSIIGAILWELLKYGFFNVSSWAIRVSVIYGTIAVVPIFLFWVFIIWMIILGALETAWVLQHKDNAWRGKTFTEMQPSDRLTFGLGLFMFIAESYEHGTPAPSADQLSRVFSVSIKDVTEMTDLLSAKGMLMPGGEDGKEWIPAKSLTKIKTIELFQAVYGISDPDVVEKSVILQRLDDFYKAGIKIIGDSTITDLLVSEEE